ncbi:matrixin family metalloprotease [Myxococcota bacterium]|nr:matrixin family metalloprotease [Myxococcota bacterium]
MSFARRAPHRAALGVLLGAWMGSSTADAYNLAHVQGAPDVPLAWEEGAVLPWVVEHHGAPGVSFPVARAAVAASFEAWDAVETAALLFEEVSEYTEPGEVVDGINTLWWEVSDWAEDPEVIAVTAVSHYEDGTIVDADIAFNGAHFQWAVGEPGAIDLQSVATHEIGHLLGLDHSDAPGATMAAEYVPGETAPRSLTDDDRAGASALYPCPDADCGLPGAGCATAPGRGPGAWGLALALVLAGRRLRRGNAPRGAAWVLAAGLLGAPAPAAASVVGRATVLDVVARADVVVRARVASVEPYFDEGGRVRSLVTLDVQRSLRGGVGARLVLDRLGGTLDGLTTRVIGAPTFEVGQDLFLCLVAADDGEFAPVGLWQGRFVVDAARRAAFRPEDGNAPHLSLDTLEAAARAYSQARIHP